MTDKLEFSHRFVPGVKGSSAPVLLLLHGTGGNEDDLLTLGRSLSSDAALLSPRGKVLENGMPRFFRRLAEGVFDEQDLIHRTHELARFVSEAAREYEFDANKVVAAGYSNGANIAASLFLLRPEVLAGGILFRAMVPLLPENLSNLNGKPVLISAGRHDPIVEPQNSERLAAMLHDAGADVSLQWSPAGHDLTAEDVAHAGRWYASKFASFQSSRDPTQGNASHGA